MSEFAGFDHLDVRVLSLAAVEPFFDRLMPLLGLSRKSYALVAGDEWTDLAEGGKHNAVEYFEPRVAGRTARFIGFIEDPQQRASATRIAFAAAGPFDAASWIERLRGLGARAVEPSADLETYPAVFFEDPGGTKFEICARRAAPA